MKSVFWALVRKDLYLLRGFLAVSVVSGLVTLAVMPFGKVGFAVGGILYITAGVCNAIFVAIFCLFTERKEQSRLFALSLPIAGHQYDLAKLVAACAAFAVQWIILTAVVVGLVPLGPAGHGVLVYALLIQCSFLAIFSALTAALLATRSDIAMTLSILTVNIMFSFLMVILNRPAVTTAITGPKLVWTMDALLILAGELIITAAALGFSAFQLSRPRDYL